MPIGFEHNWRLLFQIIETKSIKLSSYMNLSPSLYMYIFFPHIKLKREEEEGGRKEHVRKRRRTKDCRVGGDEARGRQLSPPGCHTGRQQPQPPGFSDMVPIGGWPSWPSSLFRFRPLKQYLLETAGRVDTFTKSEASTS